MTEVRGAEAWDFLKGSSSGHAGNLTTVHESTLKMLCLDWFNGAI